MMCVPSLQIAAKAFVQNPCFSPQNLSIHSITLMHLSKLIFTFLGSLEKKIRAVTPKNPAMHH